MSESRPRTESQWVYVGILTVIGLTLLWWAGEQLIDIRTFAGSEFRYPRVGLLLYLLTLTGAGVAFGLAVSGEGALRTSRRTAVVVWSLLLLLLVLAFYLMLGFGWPDGPWMNVNVIIVLTNIHVGTSVALGFFVSRLAATYRYRATGD